MSGNNLSKREKLAIIYQQFEIIDNKPDKKFLKENPAPYNITIKYTNLQQLKSDLDHYTQIACLVQAYTPSEVIPELIEDHKEKIEYIEIPEAYKLYIQFTEIPDHLEIPYASEYVEIHNRRLEMTFSD